MKLKRGSSETSTIALEQARCAANSLAQASDTVAELEQARFEQACQSTPVSLSLLHTLEYTRCRSRVLAIARMSTHSANNPNGAQVSFASGRLGKRIAGDGTTSIEGGR